MGATKLEISFDYVVLMLSGVIFATIQSYIIPILRGKLLTNSEGKEKKERSIWKFDNICGSLIHAMLSSIFTISAILYNPTLDFLLAKDLSVRFCTMFSTGYFMYDTFHTLFSNGSGGVSNNTGVFLHHILVLSSAFFCSWANLCLGYFTLTLLAEVNSFFLHLRKLEQIMKIDHHKKLYLITIGMNFFTFAVFRILPLIFISKAVIIDRDRMPRWFFVQICFIVYSLDIVNIILLWRLLRRDVFMGRKKFFEVQSRSDLRKDE